MDIYRCLQTAPEIAQLDVATRVRCFLRDISSNRQSTAAVDSQLAFHALEDIETQMCSPSEGWVKIIDRLVTRVAAPCDGLALLEFKTCHHRLTFNRGQSREVCSTKSSQSKLDLEFLVCPLHWFVCIFNSWHFLDS